MSPASIRVAPNSPKARAKARIVPALIPGIADGIMIFAKIRGSGKPSVLAACIIEESICSKDARTVLYAKGNATTLAARTVAFQSNTILIPIADKKEPIGLLFPNMQRRKNPRTVGGKTNGNVNKPSNIPENHDSFFEVNFVCKKTTAHAAGSPNNNEMSVAKIEALIDIKKGDQSIDVEYSGKR